MTSAVLLTALVIGVLIISIEVGPWWLALYCALILVIAIWKAIVDGES